MLLISMISIEICWTNDTLHSKRKTNMCAGSRKLCKPAYHY